jgi:DNA-binding LytR/AlgR family response regulator
MSYMTQPTLETGRGAVGTPLKELLEQLDAEQFAQAHRSSS